MAVVCPEERSASDYRRSPDHGRGLGPRIGGLLVSHPSLIEVPLYLAGGLKIAYDLLLYRAFIAVQPPEKIDRKSVV